MIKNAKQLTVTKRQLAVLNDALKNLKRGRQNAVVQIRRRALEADVVKLRQEIAEYERAVAGSIDFAPLALIQEFGKFLVQWRIAAKLTQDDLAHELGRKPQQIQRYEREQYSSASLGTLKRVAGVLEGKVSAGAGRTKTH